jgi:hypothetical protein
LANDFARHPVAAAGRVALSALAFLHDVIHDPRNVIFDVIVVVSIVLAPPTMFLTMLLMFVLMMTSALDCIPCVCDSAYLKRANRHRTRMPAWTQNQRTGASPQTI